MLPFCDAALETRIEGIAREEREELRLAIEALVVAIMVA